MCASDLAPNNTELAALLFCLSLVDVSNFLSQIKLSLWLGGDAFNLDERRVVILVYFAPVDLKMEGGLDGLM
jgi:hypothetical protein